MRDAIQAAKEFIKRHDEAWPARFTIEQAGKLLNVLKTCPELKELGEK
jgi:hypothetical protein